MSATGAERARLYRIRQRDNVQIVHIPVSISAVFTLIQHGLLPDGIEHDRQQIADAVSRLLSKVGNDAVD